GLGAVGSGQRVVARPSARDYAEWLCPTPPGRPEPMRTPVLLVIDDEPAILSVFRIAFAEPEAKLLAAPTAAEGLRLFFEQRPDVVILDVRLPDMDGRELFRRLHESDAKVPVILMTGFGTA